ncbi:MAG: Nif11-like leader peptide family natural product precursor [Atopobiaceae bacterium]|nr:Nif11-like leader peptide family natural product precursor [Atopobiaceae bacterium]MBR1828767.1 Nif11-like leader peptide family natural product precursor [Atopobiaceae bacterium]
MNLDALTPELLEKAAACETPQELMELAQANGIEITDADLDKIAGGVIGPETQEALEKLTPEERENCRKIAEGYKKWAEKEHHPGWQGH